MVSYKWDPLPSGLLLPRGSKAAVVPLGKGRPGPPRPNQKTPGDLPQMFLSPWGSDPDDRIDRIFSGEKSLFHQLGDEAMGMPPVQIQSGGQLSLGASGVFSHIENREQRAEAQARLMQPSRGIGDKAAVKQGNIVRQSLKHE